MMVGSFRLAMDGFADDTPAIMGDKSPKAANKHAAQKQAKANATSQKKTSADTAKQVMKLKK